MKIYLELEARVSSDSVSFRYIFADESLRICDPEFKYCCVNGMEIRSYEFPEIHEYAIYLIGKLKERDKIYFVSYPYKTDIYDFRNKILSALYEFISAKFNCKLAIFIEDSVFKFVETDITQCYSKE